MKKIGNILAMAFPHSGQSFGGRQLVQRVRPRGTTRQIIRNVKKEEVYQAATPEIHLRSRLLH